MSTKMCLTILFIISNYINSTLIVYHSTQILKLIFLLNNGISNFGKEITKKVCNNLHRSTPSANVHKNTSIIINSLSYINKITIIAILTQIVNRSTNLNFFANYELQVIITLIHKISHTIATDLTLLLFLYYMI